MTYNNDILREILSEYDKKPVYHIDKIILTKSVEDKDLLVVNFDTTNQNFILLSEYQKRISDSRNNKISLLL